MSEENQLGYSEALALEQFHRNAVYLDLPEIVCGEKVENITPRLLARLTAIKSPFLVGGERFSLPHVWQFLWALSPVYDPLDKRTPKAIARRIAILDVDDCVAEIDAFMEVTFMDALDDGKKETPIAASVAWLIYSFRGEPFFQTPEQTLDVPLRKLYQELRCHRKTQGGVVMNDKSGKIKADAFAVINKAVQDAIESGEMTQEEWDYYCTTGKLLQDMTDKDQAEALRVWKGQAT